MPLICNNIIVGGKKVEEPKKVPPVKTFIETKIVENKTEETPSTYHEVSDGELTKLYNKKSDYLNDMIAFKE